MEIYMNDMIVKFGVDKLHDGHLHHVFKRVRQYNMRFSPERFIFFVRAEILYLYLVIVEETISVFLIREIYVWKSPIYFVSKALAGEETQSQKLRKLP